MNLERRLQQLEKVTIGLFMTTGAAVAVANIVLRNVAPHHTPDWLDETLIYTVTWAIWLSIPGLARTHEHIINDAFLRYLPDRLVRILNVAALVLSLCLCLLLMTGGVFVVDLAVVFAERSDSSLQAPLWIYYLGLPVGMGLSSVCYALHLYRLIVQ